MLEVFSDLICFSSRKQIDHEKLLQCSKSTEFDLNSFLKHRCKRPLLLLVLFTFMKMKPLSYDDWLWLVVVSQGSTSSSNYNLEGFAGARKSLRILYVLLPNVVRDVAITFFLSSISLAMTYCSNRSLCAIQFTIVGLKGSMVHWFFVLFN